MPVEERQRVALREQAAATWGEEAADTLMELVTPPGHDPATTQDLTGLRREMHDGFARVDERFARVDERFARVDERFDRLDERLDARFASVDERMESMEHRLSALFERRITDAVSAQTRTLVWSQLAALVTISALAFGLR